VKVLDLSKDKDHNRADMTILGAPDAVEAAVMAVTSRALELIDMRKHKGSHPAWAPWTWCRSSRCGT